MFQVTIDACVCDRGFRLNLASSSCVACDFHSYKTQPGNIETCTACPSGLITYGTGSVSASSCVAQTATGDTDDTGDGETGDTGDTDTDGGDSGGSSSDNQTSRNGSDGNSSTPGNTTPSTDGDSEVSAPRNESDVPAVAFNMSLDNFPSTSDVDSIKVQVIATWRVCVKSFSYFFCTVAARLLSGRSFPQHGVVLYHTVWLLSFCRSSLSLPPIPCEGLGPFVSVGHVL